MTRIAGFVLLTGFVSGVRGEAGSATLDLPPAIRSKCLATLREGLKSEEFWPSMHAAEALTLAGEAEQVRRSLRPRVASEGDAQRRCGLARELVRAGDKSVLQILFDVLESPDPYGHVHAAESLFKVSEVGDGQKLREAARSTNVKLRLMAAAALARCGSPSALASVRAPLQGPDREAAQIAAWILAQIGSAEDTKPLRGRLEQESDPLKRAYIINALATLGDADGRKRLLDNLGHTDGAVRTYSAEFAGHARLTGAADKLIGLLDDPVTDVRVRAAQSLLVLAQRPIEGGAVIVRDVYTATAQNPRYSEGSIIERGDGNLLFAITEFVGAGEDHSTAQIVGRTSADGGRSWDAPRVLQANVGTQNVMSVTLCRLKPTPIGAAPIGMFYLVKNSPSDLNVLLRVSTDEGRTFGEPIVVTRAPGYHVMNNDRVTRLASGRLICPISWTADVAGEGHFVSFCYVSDDGNTWRRSRNEVDLPQRGAMEPQTIELNDGTLLMFLRTQLGAIYACQSADGGLTWSKPASWNVESPEAPATLRRIPATGDLVLIYNPVFRAGSGHGGPRTPLALALSADEGRTWQRRADLETRTDQTYAYTSATFVKDRLVLSYYVADAKTGRISTRFRSMPIGQLYRDPPAKGEGMTNDQAPMT